MNDVSTNGGNSGAVTNGVKRGAVTNAEHMGL